MVCFVEVFFNFHLCDFWTLIVFVLLGRFLLLRYHVFLVSFVICDDFFSLFFVPNFLSVSLFFFFFLCFSSFEASSRVTRSSFKKSVLISKTSGEARRAAGRGPKRSQGFGWCDGVWVRWDVVRCGDMCYGELQCGSIKRVDVKSGVTWWGVLPFPGVGYRESLAILLVW